MLITDLDIYTLEHIFSYIDPHRRVPAKYRSICKHIKFAIDLEFMLERPILENKGLAFQDPGWTFQFVRRTPPRLWRAIEKFRDEALYRIATFNPANERLDLLLFIVLCLPGFIPNQDIGIEAASEILCTYGVSLGTLYDYYLHNDTESYKIEGADILREKTSKGYVYILCTKFIWEGSIVYHLALEDNVTYMKKIGCAVYSEDGQLLDEEEAVREYKTVWRHGGLDRVRGVLRAEIYKKKHNVL